MCLTERSRMHRRPAGNSALLLFRRTGYRGNEGNELMIRKRIVFSGQVQHVGFRWRARQAASLYDCTGWCRNERDGTVTMEIQGSEEAISLVIQGIQSGQWIWIHGMDVTVIPVEPDERGFGTD